MSDELARDTRLPAYINRASGSATAAREALDGAAGFDIHETAPAQIADAVRAAAAGGAPRILISGGDGTIATAAAALAGTHTALAILPGGTLNHFARDFGIPTNAADALALARTGSARAVDLGTVNGRHFINTSSVGAYVHFVRVRELLEQRFGYRIASFLAALRALFQLRRFAVELELNGERRVYRTPLVFIGVGERELQLPAVGKRLDGGTRGLHVLIVRGRSRARLFAIALNAAARGVGSASRMPELDSFIVDRCTITTRRHRTVAVDGELVTMASPLQYEIARDAVLVVRPPEGAPA